MMRRAKYPACLLAGMFVLTGTIFAWGQPPLTKLTAEDLLPGNRKQLDAAFGRALEHRRATVDALRHIVRTDVDVPGAPISTRRAYAVILLGDYRAAEATDGLLAIIDQSYPQTAGPAGASHEPLVVAALVKIGKPASRGALEFLAKDKSSERAGLYARVIALVEGIELGKKMLRRAAEREKDPARKARLQAAIELVKDDAPKLP